MKKHYYVLVHDNGQAKFVTKLNNVTKYAHWNSNEKPLKLAKTYAEDIAYCLNLNFYPAFVIESYYEIEEQIFCNKKEEIKNED